MRTTQQRITPGDIRASRDRSRRADPIAFALVLSLGFGSPPPTHAAAQEQQGVPVERVTYDGTLTLCGQRVNDLTTPVGTVNWRVEGVSEDISRLHCSNAGVGPVGPSMDYQLDCNRHHDYCIRPDVRVPEGPGAEDSYVFDARSGIDGSVPHVTVSWDESPVLVKLDARLYCTTENACTRDCTPAGAPVTTTVSASVFAEGTSPCVTRTFQASSRAPAAGGVGHLEFYVKRPADGSATAWVTVSGACDGVPVTRTCAVEIDMAAAPDCGVADVGDVNFCANPGNPENPEMKIIWTDGGPEQTSCASGATRFTPTLEPARIDLWLLDAPEEDDFGQFVMSGRPLARNEITTTGIPASPAIRGLRFQALYDPWTSLDWVRHYARLDAAEVDLGTVLNPTARLFSALAFSPRSNPTSVAAYSYAYLWLIGEQSAHDPQPLLPFTTPPVDEPLLGTFRQKARREIRPEHLGQTLEIPVADGRHRPGEVELNFYDSLYAHRSAYLSDLRVPVEYRADQCRERNLEYCLGRVVFELEDSDRATLQYPSAKGESTLDSGDEYVVTSASSNNGQSGQRVQVAFDLPEDTYSFHDFYVNKGSNRIQLDYREDSLHVACGSNCCYGIGKPSVCLDEIADCVPEIGTELVIRGTADHETGVGRIVIEGSSDGGRNWQPLLELLPGDPRRSLTAGSTTREEFEAGVRFPAPGDWLVRVTAFTPDSDPDLAVISCNEAHAVHVDAAVPAFECGYDLDLPWPTPLINPVYGAVCSADVDILFRGTYCGDRGYDVTCEFWRVGDSAPISRGDDVCHIFIGQGDYEVRFVATDVFGNQRTCVVPIHNEEATPPTLDCPDDRIVEADQPDSDGDGICEARVDYQVCANDDCTPNLVPTLTLTPPGATDIVNLGTPLQVEANVADQAGNDAVPCRFQIVAVDTRAPEIVQGPPALTTLRLSAEADDDGDGRPGDSDCKVSWKTPVQAVDLCSAPHLAVTPAPFEYAAQAILAADLAPGAYGGTLTATDTWGNLAERNFAVHVLDDVPPVIECGSKDPLNPDAIISFVGDPPTAILVHPFSATDNCEKLCCDARVNGVVVEAGQTYPITPSRTPGVELDDEGKPVRFLGTSFTGELSCGCSSYCQTTLTITTGRTDCTLAFFRQESPGPHTMSRLHIHNDAAPTAFATITVYSYTGDILATAPGQIVPGEGNLVMNFEDPPLRLALPPNQVLVGWVRVQSDSFLDSHLELDTNASSDNPSGVTLQCVTTLSPSEVTTYYKLIRNSNDTNDNAKRRPVLAVVNRSSASNTVTIRAWDRSGTARGTWVSPPVPVNAAIYFNTAVTGMDTVEGNLEINAEGAVALSQLTFGPNATLSNRPPEPWIVPLTMDVALADVGQGR